jgi:hypothetical protein
MFTLNAHARRKAGIVAVGALAALTAGNAAQAYVHDDVYFDPGLSAAGTGTGGTGSFDQNSVNFYNPRLGVDQKIFLPTGPNMDGTHAGYWTGDNIHFATTPGVVTVNSATTATQMTIDIGGYTIQGAPLTLGGGYQAYNANNTGQATPVPFLTSSAGTNTITSNLIFQSGNRASRSAIEVTAGTLTIGNFTYTGGNYGDLHKTGTGTLIVNGTFDMGQSDSEVLYVNAGTVNLNNPARTNSALDTTGNQINQGVEVSSGGTLGGVGGIRITGASLDDNTGLAPFFKILGGGHLSPGNNPAGSNFGSVGTFTLNGGYGAGQTLTGTFHSTSNFDIDIASTSSYDSFQFTKGNYSTNLLVIEDGAIVNINALAPLAEGTYHIVTTSGGVSITDGGFDIGTAPSGYNYEFVQVLNGSTVTGIDLVVTAAPIPEPASLAVLGLGATAMLIRTRRRAR